MLIVNNIDHLFNMPNYSAVAAGQCAIPEYSNLNSGLMVIEPNKALYTKLLNSIEPAMHRRINLGYNFGDQDIFQEAFKDWEEHSELKLPETYNCFFRDMRVLARKDQIKLREISVVHFIGKEKPWSYGCFSKHNVRRCLSLIIHRRFYELKIYIEYLLLATK